MGAMAEVIDMMITISTISIININTIKTNITKINMGIISINTTTTNITKINIATINMGIMDIPKAVESISASKHYIPNVILFALAIF